LRQETSLAHKFLTLTTRLMSLRYQLAPPYFTLQLHRPKGEQSSKAVHTR
jgi:hypothetical protein